MPNILIGDKMEYSKEYLKESSIERLAADIGNDVYAAGSIIERLEGVGRISGSGHCLRQELAEHAKRLLVENIR